MVNFLLKKSGYILAVSPDSFQSFCCHIELTILAISTVMDASPSSTRHHTASPGTSPGTSQEDWWEKQAAELDLLEWVLFRVEPQTWLDTYMADRDLVARMLHGVEVDGWYEV